MGLEDVLTDRNLREVFDQAERKHRGREQVEDEGFVGMDIGEEVEPVKRSSGKRKRCKVCGDSKDIEEFRRPKYVMSVCNACAAKKKGEPKSTAAAAEKPKELRRARLCCPHCGGVVFQLEP